MKLQHPESNLRLNKMSIAKLSSKEMRLIKSGSIDEIISKSSLPCLDEMQTIATIRYTMRGCV